MKTTGLETHGFFPSVCDFNLQVPCSRRNVLTAVIDQSVPESGFGKNNFLFFSKSGRRKSCNLNLYNEVNLLMTWSVASAEQLPAPMVTCVGEKPLYSLDQSTRRNSFPLCSRVRGIKDGVLVFSVLRKGRWKAGHTVRKRVWSTHIRTKRLKQCKKR